MLSNYKLEIIYEDHRFTRYAIIDKSRRIGEMTIKKTYDNYKYSKAILHIDTKR